MSHLGIIGGGPAGLAAAAAALEAGLCVTLYESRSGLGGRAGSFREPVVGQTIDLCQHVVLGCCTNWLDFARRMGIDGEFVCQRKMYLVDAYGRTEMLAPAAWLPAPLGWLPAVLALQQYGPLSRRGRLIKTLALLGRGWPRQRPGEGRGDHETLGPWLRAQGHTDEEINGLWSAIIESALADSVERISLAAAAKVVRDGMLRHRDAANIYTCHRPLAELFAQVTSRLSASGAGIRLRAAAKRMVLDEYGRAQIVLADDSRPLHNFVISTVSPSTLIALLPEPLHRQWPAAGNWKELPFGAIGSLHLWLDRPITNLPNAMLPGGTAQWLFRMHADSATSTSVGEKVFYYQLVASAADGWMHRPRAEVFDAAMALLHQRFPAARDARVRHWRLVRMPRAVIACRPGVEELRPAATTPVPNLMLAGDWTATGWPGTLEGAVRSGRRAIEAVLAALGRPRRILTPDLPASWLCRLLGL